MSDRATTATASQGSRKVFRCILIRPSHYDDDGYVIQWHRSLVPSNSLATLYGLYRDLAERQVLGEDVRIDITAIDESNTRIRPQQMIRKIEQADGGMVAMVGVQTNQFPRSIDLATQFRDAGIPVCLGGFHVSGCMAMLPETTPEIKQAMEMGISLFVGEAEGRLEQVVRDAWQGEMQPLYNHLNNLPDLSSQPVPFLPAEVLHRSAGSSSSFDAGRGCPFVCSFCTIINVQGRKSRSRSVDTIEQIIRENAAQGIFRFLITDDNFARNRDWEAIFDRLTKLRYRDNLVIRLILQVDTMCHRIPGFIEKARHAGVAAVFIGMESVNPETLVATGKRQNKVEEYRKTLLTWSKAQVLTMGSYIIGFPNDTVESIARDIDLIQRELPLDLMFVSYLTPLPGSADHKQMVADGVWMDPDLNNYDLHHVTIRHPNMSQDALRGANEYAMERFFSDAQVETRMRRAHANGVSIKAVAAANLWYYTCQLEKVAYPEGGVIRRKFRRDRRPGLPIESPFIFYPRRIVEQISIYGRLGMKALKYRRMVRRILADPEATSYTDAAIAPISDADTRRNRGMVEKKA